MNARSIRFRLIAWYAGWLTVVFFGFGVFVYLGLRHYLEFTLQDSLARRARRVVDTIERSDRQGHAVGRDIHEIFAPEANSRFIRLTVNGVLTYVSAPPADGSFDPAEVPVLPSPSPGKTSQRIRLADGTVLFLEALSVLSKDKRITIEIGAAADLIEATLREWLVLLGLGVVPLVLVSAGGGFLLVQRALAPVDQIVRTAEHIGSQNLSERLPVPNTRDELARLSIALNNMIGRLDEGFQHTQRFLADASHELRTPLTIMQGELESVIQQTADQPAVREIAGSALEEVERLKEIVEELFALSRLDAGERGGNQVSLDLGELAASTADQMALLAEDKNISITCRSLQKVLVQGDRARLKQVTVNLLDNAIKYTPHGGRIDVTVSTRNGCGFLEVTDNGIGISGEALPHVFDRFFRVDKARSREMGGAGLGLSIVQAICVAHGGSVAAYSKEGEGSRFVVELPLANGATH